MVTEVELENAFEKAKKWCEKNLGKFLPVKKIDYSVFQFKIDNNNLGMDMWLEKDTLDNSCVYMISHSVLRNSTLMDCNKITEFLKPLSLVDYFNLDRKIENCNRLSRGLKRCNAY